MSIKGVLWIKSTLVLGKINGWSWVLLVILFDVMVISCSSNAGGLGWWFIIFMCLYIYIFLLGNLCIVFFKVYYQPEPPSELLVLTEVY